MESAKESSPTLDFYAQLQRAFDHFNEQLFDGKLPPCLITLRSSYRHYGYHHADRFVNKQGQTLDELGLHPGFFTLRPVEEVLSYLVHEMVHHWQDRLGQPSKSNPHNKEWAQKMREVGLEPSSTGLPSGKDTGQSMSHYIQPDGRFIKSCRELLAKRATGRWPVAYGKAWCSRTDACCQEAANTLAGRDSADPVERMGYPNICLPSSFQGAATQAERGRRAASLCPGAPASR